MSDPDLDRIVPSLWPPNSKYNLSGPSAAYHLVADRDCDETMVFCGAPYAPTRGYTDEPTEAGCLECLRIASRYAGRITRRRIELEAAQCA